MSRADFAERASGIVVGLSNDRVGELLLAQRRHFFRIERLRVETRALHDRQAGHLRCLANEVEVHAGAFEPCVDEARHAIVLRVVQFFRHEIHIPLRIGAGRSGRRPRRPAGGRHALRGQHRRRGSPEAIAEIRAERHMLVEQRRAACQLFRSVVLEQSANDRAFGEGGRLRECAHRCGGERGRCGTRGLQCLSTGQRHHGQSSRLPAGAPILAAESNQSRVMRM